VSVRRSLQALKARNGDFVAETVRIKAALAVITRLQRSGNLAGWNLGRWPKLLHFAPLALKL
jgi:hypothetical protein